MEENMSFNFSIAELCQRGDKLIATYLRDQAEFVNYGYSAETATAIETQTNELKEFPTDDYYEGLQQIATNNKNKSRASLEYNLVDLRNRARLVYGINSVDYKAFKLKRVGDLNDNELVQRALLACQVAAPRLVPLGKRMVSQESLDVIMNDREQLDNDIDKQAAAITQRREKKIERTRKANKLYKLISEISDVGKLIWKGKNEAYYLDYVIYGSAKAVAQQDEELETEVSDTI